MVGFALASDEAFEGFTKTFGKAYRNDGEMLKRRAIFKQNYAAMEEHNKRFEAGLESWNQGVHEDMDLSAEEWMTKRTGGLPPMDENAIPLDNLSTEVLEKLNNLGPAPREFNWISQGGVSSVKNQAQCGSCAAFAALGAIESCSKIQTGTMANDLSEQHLLDCAYNHVVNDGSGSWGAYGCDGAWPQAYLDWIKGNYDQEESFYPYTSGSSGHTGACRPNANGYNKHFRVTGYHNTWYTHENDMQNMVQINPVVSSVQATNNWSSYRGGVLNDHSCCNAATDPQCTHKLNHAILVVGYGHDSASGLDYWLIKNSWGTSWGENGFLKLKRGTGHCGIGCMHQTIPTCAKV